MSLAIIPNPEEFGMLEKLAKYANESQYFKTVGGVGGLFSIMLYAHELGLKPMQCLFSGMYNIKGKIEISAALMNSMIRKAGHRIEILRSDDEECTIKGVRKDTGEEFSCTVNFQVCKKLGMVSPTWDKFPSDMLFARALKRVARRLFSDVIGSAFIEGEVKDELEEEKIIVKALPPKEKPLSLRARPQEAQLIEISVKKEPPQTEEKPSLSPNPFEMTFDECCEYVSKIIACVNNAQMRSYVAFCLSRSPRTLDEFVTACEEKPQAVISHYETWKKRQVSEGSDSGEKPEEIL